MNHTKIDWAEYSWNPVTGCKHGCDYCYARRIAERFHGTDGFKPTFHPERLSEPATIKKPSRIFVCSMADLFGDWVPDEWIVRVFEACDKAPQHTYLFLTKNPSRYYFNALQDYHGHGYRDDEKPPQNWWFGATMTDCNDNLTGELLRTVHDRGGHTWASAEPLLDDLANCKPWFPWFIDWLVIGAMTGPGSKDRQPKKEWVDSLSSAALQRSIPLFQKQSLAKFFDGKTIQEYPVAMIREVTHV